MATLVALALGCGDDGMGEPTGTGSVSGQVSLSGPIGGATVTAEQLSLETGEVTAIVTEVTADAEGQFSLETGLANGLIRFTARGGAYTDAASGERIELDATTALETVVEVGLLETRSGVRITGVGHLIAARMRAGVAAGEDALTAFATATEHLNRHFGATSWDTVVPVDLTVPAASPTEPVRAALVEVALSYLAADIASEPGASAQDVTVAALVQQWAADLEADGLFDGNDGNAREDSGLKLGPCGDLSECPIQTVGCVDGSCRPLCDLYVGTARALLGGAMNKVFNFDGQDGRPLVNGTQLSVTDLRPVALSISNNVDEYLFGSACVETLDRTPPTVSFANTPAEGMIVGGTVVLSAGAVDDIDEMPRVVLEGCPAGCSDEDASNERATVTIDTTADPDGVLTVMATATDAAGNRAMALRQLVTDNTAPVVAFTSSGFFVDGTTWWTATDGPTLAGTVADASPTQITVFVGAQAVPGTATGTTWSVMLPAGLLAAAGSDVRVVATDAAGNPGEAVQRFRVDATPPQLTPQATSVSNEAGDVVAFETDFQLLTYGSPRHTHSGIPIQLDVLGTCPTVVKHSYLLGTASPPYVGEPSGRNPIAYAAVAADDGVGIVGGSTQYRVGRRDATGAMSWILDWTSAGPGVDVSPGAKRHDVAITAPLVPGLDTTEATYDVELRTTDRLGRTATAARCFALQLLAPRLFQEYAGPATSARALSKLSLNPAAGQTETLHTRLLNGVASETGAALIEHRVINGSTSLVYLTVSVTRPSSITLTRAFTLRTAVTNVRTVNENCSLDMTACDGQTFPPPVNVGDITETPMRPEVPVRVFAAGSGTELAATSVTLGTMQGQPDIYRFTLPGRPTMISSSATTFVVTTTLGQQSGLWPTNTAFPAAPPFTASAVAGITITGKVSASSDPCTDTAVNPATGAERCIERSTYRPYRALTHIKVDFPTSEITATLQTAATSQLAPRPLGMVLSYSIDFETSEQALP